MPSPAIPSTAKRVLLVVCTLPFLAAGGVLTWLGVGAVRAELGLRNGDATVEAKVTGSRIMKRSRSGTSYEVTYRFKVKGSSESYDRTDESGRTNLWSSVADEETWQEARESGRLTVSYLPADPNINRPLKGGKSPLGDAVAGLVLGLVLTIVSLLIALVQIKGLSKPKPT